MIRRRIIVIGIIALAAAVRLWALADYPPGLFPDQAANGFDALDILDGKLQAFSVRNNGRESLFFYVQALTVGLFGIGVWQMFLASALVGTVTVAVTYAAGARLFGAVPAMAAALFLATNPWHVTLSRTGFRAVMVPLFIALALWCIARVLQGGSNPQRGLDALLAGVFTGLGLYTYPSYRAFVVFLALAAAIGLLRLALQPAFRARMREVLPALVIAGGTALIVALPLLAVFLLQPEFLTARVDHVSVFNPALNNGDPLGTFLTMAGRTLRAFFWDGDGNPRHNVPLTGLPYTPGGSHHFAGGGAPFLSFVPAVLALAGAVVVLRRAPWLLALFFVMLLPAALTAEGIPHGLRSVGAIPAHVWLAGLGAGFVWRGVRFHPWTPVRAGARVLALSIVLFTAISDITLYFGVARNLPLAHYEYRGDLTVVSAYLNERAVGSRPARTASQSDAGGQQVGGAPPCPLPTAPCPLPYLVLDDFSVMTVRFLTTPAGQGTPGAPLRTAKQSYGDPSPTEFPKEIPKGTPGQPYRLVDPATSHLTPLNPGEEIVFTQSTLPDAARYQSVHPAVVVREVKENRFGEIIMVIIEHPAGG